jgi:hypothetical protein
MTGRGGDAKTIITHAEAASLKSWKNEESDGKRLPYKKTFVTYLGNVG